MVPARGPWGFSHRGTSSCQTPTSVHARFRAGNGEERGRTQHARNPATLPLANPQPHCVHPASVRGPRSCHRLEIATAPAGSTRPGAQPSARRPPAPVGVPLSRDLEAPDAHQRARTLLGWERGRAGVDPARSQPHHAPAQEPPAASRPPRLSQGPMVFYSRRPLPTGRGP